MQRAFTLLELSVVVAIIFVLAALGLGVIGKMKTSAYQAKSTSNLRQLGLATQLYLNENEYQFFNYRLDSPSGVTWWYGFESAGSQGSGAGNRKVDKTRSPLYPYLNQVGGVEICPGFDYASPHWQPRYSGATHGYGYNVVLCAAPDAGGATSGWSGKGVPFRMQNLSSHSKVPLFATCAQIDPFQRGSTGGARKIEEFPGFDAREYVIHGRFGGRALALFVDGHTEAIALDPKAIDPRQPSARIGRFPKTMIYK
jgi:prepilin-type N-terminal cleavage/methylation domain-containing protein